MLHYFTINSQGRRSIWRASKMFQERSEALTHDQVPFSESPGLCHSQTLLIKPCANDLTFGLTFHLTFAMRSSLILAKCANEPNISPNI